MHLLKNARGHLFLFQNNFSAFKYFYRASSEKKSPWASFSIPKYFFILQIFLQGIFRKKEPAGIFRKKEPAGIFRRKEPMGIFFYSQIFFSIQIFLQGIFRKKEPAGIFRKKEPMGIFFYCKKTQKTLKDASLIKNMT